MRYAHAKHTSVNRSILVHVAILAANLQYYLCIQNCLYSTISYTFVSLFSRSSLALAILMSKLRGSLEYG